MAVCSLKSYFIKIFFIKVKNTLIVSYVLNGISAFCKFQKLYISCDVSNDLLLTELDNPVSNELDRVAHLVDTNRSTDLLSGLEKTVGESEVAHSNLRQHVPMTLQVMYNTFIIFLFILCIILKQRVCSHIQTYQ